MDLTTPTSVCVLTCFVNYDDKNHSKTITSPQVKKNLLYLVVQQTSIIQVAQGFLSLKN
jgi:hypothetical protein